jgi:hypothetical protein
LEDADKVFKEVKRKWIVFKERVVIHVCKKDLALLSNCIFLFHVSHQGSETFEYMLRKVGNYWLVIPYRSRES